MVFDNFCCTIQDAQGAGKQHAQRQTVPEQVAAKGPVVPKEDATQGPVANSPAEPQQEAAKSPAVVKKKAEAPMPPMPTLAQQQVTYPRSHS